MRAILKTGRFASSNNAQRRRRVESGTRLQRSVSRDYSTAEPIIDARSDHIDVLTDMFIVV